MIDTMAFLLVFFMIASLAMTQQMGMTVNLPRAGAARPQTSADRMLVVTADEQGHLFINKQSIGWSALEDAVRRRLRERPGLVVVVNADENLRHGAVVRVIDAIRRAGAEHLSIATKSPKRDGVGPDDLLER